MKMGAIQAPLKHIRRDSVRHGLQSPIFLRIGRFPLFPACGHPRQSRHLLSSLPLPTKAVGHQKDQMTNAATHPLERILAQRIAILDGAMGTTIRTYGMKEADIRGERFKDAKKDLLNNGDLFSLTQPKMIGDIHRRFLEAGADIIETNTFGATSIAQSEFFVDDPRERGGRKDPEFYQKVIDDQVPQRPRLGDQRAVGAAVPRVGRSRGQRDRAPAVCRGRHRAADGVAFELARRRRCGVSRGHLRSGEGGVRSSRCAR